VNSAQRGAPRSRDKMVVGLYDLSEFVGEAADTLRLLHTLLNLSLTSDNLTAHTLRKLAPLLTLGGFPTGRGSVRNGAVGGGRVLGSFLNRGLFAVGGGFLLYLKGFVLYRFFLGGFRFRFSQFLYRFSLNLFRFILHYFFSGIILSLRPCLLNRFAACVAHFRFLSLASLMRSIRRSRSYLLPGVKSRARSLAAFSHVSL